MVRKIRTVFLVFVSLFGSVFHVLEGTTLLTGRDIDEKTAVSQLRRYSGLTVLEEYICLENKGFDNLIPYAVVLMEKYDEFSPDYLISLMLRNDTLSEVESVLVEMLHLHQYDFSELLFLQDQDSI